MLKTSELIQGIEEQYIPMLKKVDIPNFTKTIAVFSELRMSEIDDEVIKEYLHIWAKNKYFLFKFLGNSLTKTEKIFLKKDEEDRENLINSLIDKYPYMNYWITNFCNFKENKFHISNLNYRLREEVKELLPKIPDSEMTITNFFKNWLKTPENFVIDLAKLWEGMDGDYYFYTISIDPVDYMLASETPFKWDSCYSIHKSFEEGNHSDGCLAALLDSAHAISYTWKNAGKMTINPYEFKNVKYKHLRQWVVFSKDLLQLYFCRLYPESRRDGENNYEKTLRLTLEKMVTEYLKIEDSWKRLPQHDHIERRLYYGYNEFDKESLIVHKSLGEGLTTEELIDNFEPIEVYTEWIKCPCGCGDYLEGSDIFDKIVSETDENDEEEEKPDYLDYTGGGFNCGNYCEKRYCPIDRGWCEYGGEACAETCSACDSWKDQHAFCPITNQRCGLPNGVLSSEDAFRSDNNLVISHMECKDCPAGCKFIKEFAEGEEIIADKTTLTEERLNSMTPYGRRSYLQDYSTDEDIWLTRAQIIELASSKYGGFNIRDFVEATETYNHQAKSPFIYPIKPTV